MTAGMLAADAESRAGGDGNGCVAVVAGVIRPRPLWLTPRRRSPAGLRPGGGGWLARAGRPLVSSPRPNDADPWLQPPVSLSSWMPGRADPGCSGGHRHQPAAAARRHRLTPLAPGSPTRRPAAWLAATEPPCPISSMRRRPAEPSAAALPPLPTQAGAHPGWCRIPSGFRAGWTRMSLCCWRPRRGCRVRRGAVLRVVS